MYAPGVPAATGRPGVDAPARSPRLGAMAAYRGAPRDRSGRVGGRRRSAGDAPAGSDAAPAEGGRDDGSGPTAAGRFDDAPFIRACRRQTVDRVPVWFMRQAGRSLPEYRAARGPGSILDAIAQPELVARLTRQPVDRYGTDAAIFFSDIVVPVAAIGFGVDVAPSTGPVVAAAVPGARTTSSASGRSSPRSTRPTSSRRWASWPASSTFR